jgi:anti-sigma factor RsiW
MSSVEKNADSQIIVDDFACRELVELVTKYLEDRLTPEQRLAFVAHLSQCGGCHRYVAQMHFTLYALRSLPPEPVTPAEQQRLLAAYRAWAAARAV